MARGPLQYRDFDTGRLEELGSRQRQAFARQGVRSCFHVPVVSFGERMARPGDFGRLGALPTGRVLAPGKPVIPDAAPFYGRDAWYLDDDLPHHRRWAAAT